jgi:hypothetical protein
LTALDVVFLGGESTPPPSNCLRPPELLSEGLYTSPNKAIEELVANAFDAGGHRVHVLLPPNLHDQDVEPSARRRRKRP